ncbi:hypothetical protein [Aurantiacibacter sediminis]|uniref:Uncharacterized protein n=1 Tax=Aurantiacibacter sediminis TaxID=2793064 RepID=A0ABS0N1U8_9SPHN|nr:hypothetical protein [Aurantiacibacter sediminis]MBH5321931.1 hypothetical protein [Aurantiacibacter sediminis]
MPLSKKWFAACAASTCIMGLAATGTASAQDTIVVEGERIETADIRNTARDITSGARAMFQPLARFQRPVCPGVYGLSEDAAQAVLDRIVANAISAGIDVSEEPECGANVWVIVVDDAAATFEQLVEEDSFMTRHLTPFQERTVRDQNGAARAWNLITRRNPDTGQRIPDGFDNTASYVESRTRPVDTPINETSEISRLDLAIRTDIELSVVLVERAALDDLEVVALADYSTMRLLAPTEPPAEDNAVRTVLTLFQPGLGETSPRELTAFDLGYLTALYRSSPTRPARLAMGGIQYQMERIGDEQDEAEDE